MTWMASGPAPSVRQTAIIRWPLTFKADGATLTGTTSGPDGAEVKIADGKIDGNNLSFTVTFDFQGMPLMISYKGVMSGTEIKFTLDVFGMPMDLSVKKST